MKFALKIWSFFEKYQQVIKRIILVSLFFFLLLLFFNTVFLKIQPLLQIFNLCFLVFVINLVPLRIQSSVRIFTQECDYWLDCPLPLLTLLFLPQVTSISSLPFLFSTQLCASVCVFQAVENTQGTDCWLDLSLSF